MPVNTKAIKGRIKSVGSTKKITKAMEMIAAAKMRKAVNAALDTRTYATLAWDLLVSLSKTEKTHLPLLAVRPVQKILVIIVTSNRGLCGSFNSNIIKKVSAQLKNPTHISKQTLKGKEVPRNENIIIDVVGIGKKGADFAKKMNYNLVAAYPTMTDTPSVNEALPIAQMAIDAYESKSYDKVIVAYTDFRSAIFQLAKLRQVLPISEGDLEKMITGKEDLDKQESKQKNLQEYTYLFEPNRL